MESLGTAPVPVLAGALPALRKRAWWLFLTFGAAATFMYMAIPKEPAKLIFWPLIGWSSVAAILVGIRMHKPTHAGAWRFLAAGTALFIIGDNFYTFRAQIQQKPLEMFPSWVDMIYLAMYPTMIVGLAWMVHRRTNRERAAVIDSAIVTSAIGLLVWVLLIAPYLDGSMRVIERLTSVAYPMGDIALLAVGVRLAVGGGTRSKSFWLLAGSIIPLIVADSLYGYLNLMGTWHEHNPVDIAWAAFYIGWGAAALHPSMRDMTERATTAPSLGGLRVFAVATAALMPPAILLVEQTMHRVEDAVAIGVIGIVLYGLVFFRIADLARTNASNKGESRFRSLVQNASDAILVVDDAGSIVYETPSTERVLGGSLMAIDGRTLGDFLHPADRQKLRSLLADPDGSTAMEWRLRNAGGWRYIDVVAADLRDEESVQGVSLTIRDSTERKKLAAEREAAVERANEASRQKSVFLANMSHEIRTPLNGLMGMLALVQGTNLDVEQRDYVTTMADSAESLAALVNDVLDFSRIEAGRLELDNEPFSLRAAVDAALSGSVSLARQKGLRVRTEIGAEVVDTVVGDRLRLRQVLSNLASNAVKFTDQGEVVVSVQNVGSMVRFDVRDTGIGMPASLRNRLFHEYVQADTSTTRRHGGSGLGLAICRQLVGLMGGEIGVESEVGQGSRFWFTIAFDTPITSVDANAKEVADATRRVLIVSSLASVRVPVAEELAARGIGAAMAADAHSAMAQLDAGAFDTVIVGVTPGGMDQLELARVIRQRHGALRIVGLTDGEPRPHATVDVWLRKPVDYSLLLHALDASEPPATNAPAALTDRQRSAAHLLVVEDNRVNQKVAVAILTKMGFTVDVASDGIEALEALERQRFDVVLMDCQMPRMDGYETTTEWRSREKGHHTPIVAMTASATSSDRDRCLAVGMDDYLTKPIDPVALERVVTSYLSPHLTNAGVNGDNHRVPPPVCARADAS